MSKEGSNETRSGWTSGSPRRRSETWSLGQDRIESWKLKKKGVKQGHMNIFRVRDKSVKNQGQMDILRVWLGVMVYYSCQGDGHTDTGLMDTNVFLGWFFHIWGHVRVNVIYKLTCIFAQGPCIRRGCVQGGCAARSSGISSTCRPPPPSGSSGSRRIS